MAKTAQYYLGQIRAASGGRIDDRTDGFELLNDAGHYLTNMHDWGWLARPPANLNFVASQEYVTLPSDFGNMLSIEVPNSLQTTVQEETLERILYLRGSSLNDPFRYHVAVVFPTQTSVTVAPGNPRLEIWPTPGSNESNALRISYRAGWTVLTAVNSVPNIPVDVEPLFIQIVRAFGAAAGNPSINLNDLLTKIEMGPITRGLKSNYGVVQGSLGMTQAGIVQLSQNYIYRPHTTITKV